MPAARALDMVEAWLVADRDEDGRKEVLDLLAWTDDDWMAYVAQERTSVLDELRTIGEVG